jgi:hypothetical protein
MTPESRRRLEQIVQTIEELGEKQRWKLLRIAQALELGGTQHAQEVMTRYSTDGWEPEAFDAARKRLSQQR